MKLIKYFFTIPFNPKKEWQKANDEMNRSSRLKEEALVLLLLMTFLSIGYSYMYDSYSGNEYFSFETAILKYFKLLAVIILVVLGIRLFGTAYKLKEIDHLKLFIIVVLGSGLIIFLSNFVFLYFQDDLWMSLFGPAFLNFIFLVLSGVYIAYGLIPNYGPNFKPKDITKNSAAIIVVVILLFALNFLYMGLLGYI